MVVLSHEQMVAAMRAKDPAFNGKFLVGVHSTGIYCLPSCKARAPLLRNVRFYTTGKAARAAGLRPCRRCHPEQFPFTQPVWARRLASHMEAHLATKFTEHDLAKIAGVNITTIRRHFKQLHGTTPLAFHRHLRLERARVLIEGGAGYLTAAYECGYQSASGFRDAFARQFGQPPGRINEHRSHRLS